MLSNVEIELLRAIEKSALSPTTSIANKLFMSRQAIHRQIQKLKAKGLINVKGKGKGVRYYLTSVSKNFDYDSVPALEEDKIWDHNILPFLPQNTEDFVVSRCRYVFTEILNNVIDHSESPDVLISIETNALKIQFVIMDHGVGIFNKISKALQLRDPKHSILELTKGKFTTDPSKHSGEGIFFASRICDKFSVLSNGLALLCRRDSNDWLFDDSDQEDIFRGTYVAMELDPTSAVKVQDVFDRFSSTEADYGFDKTQIPLSLVKENAMLVSRSQAKRVLSRVDRFKEVYLDFSGVEEIGQGFADEVFRVYRIEHPEVHFFPINMNDNVSKWVDRANKAYADYLANSGVFADKV